MRILIALGLYVSLTSAGFGQDVRERQIAGFLRTGDYTSAEQILREGIADRALDADSANNLRVALGDLLREEGKDDEAGELFRTALKNPDIAWKQRLSATMGLGGIEGERISPQAGEARWTEAISIAREHRDEDPTREADALRGLAATWLEAGDPSRAAPLLKRALKILETEPAAKDWQLASTLSATGQVYRAQDKPALAEDVWTRALELNRKAFGDAHPQVAFVMERLAEMYAEGKQFDLARQYSAQAIGVMRSSCGDDSLAVAAALANRGLVEEYAKALPAAADNYASALAIARKHPGNPALSMRIISNYTAVLRAIHHDREAKALALELKSFRQQNLR